MYLSQRPCTQIKTSRVFLHPGAQPARTRCAKKKHAARTRPAHGVARQVEDLRRPPISWLTASACAAVAMQGTLMTADSAAGASQKRKLFGNLITNWRR